VKRFLKKRLEAVLDHVLGGLALIGVLAVIGAIVGTIVAFGGRPVTIEWWEMIVLIAILLMLALGEILLLLRGRSAQQAVTDGAPANDSATARAGRFAGFLIRLDGLDTSLGEMQGNATASWTAAEIYNNIRMEAISRTGSLQIGQLATVERDSMPSLATASNEQLRVLVRQLILLLEELN
jgi:hypothetical protein